MADTLTPPVTKTPLSGSKDSKPSMGYTPYNDRWSKATKQVATVGPVSSTFEMLEKLFLAGVDVFRLNFSHGSHKEKALLVKLIRELEVKHQRCVGILADLQGPKHRVGMYPEDLKFPLTQGQMYRFDLDEGTMGDGHRVALPHPDVLAALQVGHRVLLDDGKLVVVVREKGEGFVVTEIMNDAMISSRKGFNLPDTLVESSPLTPKDREDLEFIVKEVDVDWVALSFVQTASDVMEMKTLADQYQKECGKGDIYPGKYMAKLEKPSAVTENLESIVAVCDGIMVARGDLGVEMICESLPITQRRIIDMCHLYGRPVIVATQMLESMIESPTPTRAEVSDVNTAVMDGADAVMLSAESAAGKYPEEAVSMQQRIISQVESDRSFRGAVKRRAESMSRTPTTTDAITDAAQQVAKQVGAKAIIVTTCTGTTVLRASRDRPSVPILAATNSRDTGRYLTLAWGVDPVVLEDLDFATMNFEDLLETMIQVAWEKGLVTEPTDLLVVTSGFPFGVPGAVNNLRVVSAAGPRNWDAALCN
eukprot:CAMPEP_0171633186 /NCGR_PEP_ID=MMETSP0990-20121206/25008_1 /TAXON_ID=483369 /ORGANISM="non described non described, Strain CCMP2098" /LENGTH=534 /DNA_ID=CAMNT_0012203765 /DNA_START=175 /DNA_END=1779 /DNA_ORIENTATION=-